MRTLLLLTTLLLALPLVRAAETKKKPYEAMEYGPTLTCALQINKEYVLRALNVRLDKEKQTYVCYDLETMRVAAFWSGGLIDWKGTIFSGDHHVQPKPKGTLAFFNPLGPGWAKDSSFEDPRPKSIVKYNVLWSAYEWRLNGQPTSEGKPMPADWIKYHGHYMNGERIVLSYAVQGVEVLECASVVDGALVRTFTIAPNEKELRVMLAPASQKIALSKDATGADVASDDSGQFLKIAPAKAARTFSVAIYSGEKAPEQNPQPLDALTKGGPPHWTDAVITQGVKGTEEGAYQVDTITAPDNNPWNSWMRFGGFDFYPDGKSAAICTWSGDVWIVSGIDEKLDKLTWKRFATGLYQPLGLKIVDGKIYCTCRTGIMRLTDLNGDGEADFYENFNSDVHLTRQFHEFALDLHTDSQGNFYYAKGCTPGRGGPNFDIWSLHNGAFIKVSKDGSTMEVVARGLRAPNGCGVGPHDEIVSGDNQGSWVPVCPINIIKPGAFVGVPDGVPGDVKPTKRDNPLIWIPYNVDNSSGGEAWQTDERWGPFKDQMIHLSYGKCSLFHVMEQTIGAERQAAIAKLPLAFGSGVMRARFSAADGQLYLCGLKGWQTSAGRDGIFQRVRYTNKPVNMPYSYKVTKTGLEITFTDALDKSSVLDMGSYSAERFNVIWSKNYGTPEMSLANPGKQGRDPLPIKSATLKEDGKTIVLEVPDLKPVHCMVVNIKVNAANGSKITTQICSTINAMPE